MVNSKYMIFCILVLAPWGSSIPESPKLHPPFPWAPVAMAGAGHLSILCRLSLMSLLGRGQHAHLQGAFLDSLTSKVLLPGPVTSQFSPSD